MGTLDPCTMWLSNKCWAVSCLRRGAYSDFDCSIVYLNIIVPKTANFTWWHLPFHLVHCKYDRHKWSFYFLFNRWNCFLVVFSFCVFFPSPGLAAVLQIALNMSNILQWFKKVWFSSPDEVNTKWLLSLIMMSLLQLKEKKKETKYILYVLYLQYKTVGIICHQKPVCCWDAVDALVEHDTARVQFLPCWWW